MIPSFHADAESRDTVGAYAPMSRLPCIGRREAGSVPDAATEAVHGVRRIKGVDHHFPQFPKGACGCPCGTIHRDRLESRTDFAPTSVQVEPPLVVRYMVSVGHQ